MVYHTYRLYRFLGYKSICTAKFAKKFVCQRVKCWDFIFVEYICVNGSQFKELCIMPVTQLHF
jgi:hypothetical protein